MFAELVYAHPLRRRNLPAELLDRADHNVRFPRMGDGFGKLLDVDPKLSLSLPFEGRLEDGDGRPNAPRGHPHVMHRLVVGRLVHRNRMRKHHAHRPPDGFHPVFAESGRLRRRAVPTRVQGRWIEFSLAHYSPVRSEAVSVTTGTVATYSSAVSNSHFCTSNVASPSAGNSRS